MEAVTPMNIVEGHACSSMELKWVSSRGKTQVQNMKTPSRSKAPATVLQALVPVFISTNPSHLKPDDLIDLYSACNLNGHRFPGYVDGEDGCREVEGIDANKLRVALSHSEVLVSVFCKPNDVVGSSSSSFSQKNGQRQRITEGLGELFERMVMPVTPFNSQLVGFGRAVSDQGLTASIYDVMVIPSLQGMGIGKMIVKRIIRILTSRDIYDIAALCSESESSFFKACGFGDDILCSTAMMYQRTASSSTNLDEQMVKRAGRKLLLVPPLLKTLSYSKFKTKQSS
ncbi:uncharacterized protein LOC126803339 [Argentina anserina]|uniref:uncharacterized protein LOC126803339 n=1 Tax=Argentina anserina TaxID=57926 RepID=UPI0021763696|nr:uncharacterized protein LOC126803339 [Potentilla anserina]